MVYLVTMTGSKLTIEDLHRRLTQEIDGAVIKVGAFAGDTHNGSGKTMAELASDLAIGITSFYSEDGTGLMPAPERDILSTTVIDLQGKRQALSNHVIKAMDMNHKPEWAFNNMAKVVLDLMQATIAARKYAPISGIRARARETIGRGMGVAKYKWGHMTPLYDTGEFSGKLKYTVSVVNAASGVSTPWGGFRTTPGLMFVNPGRSISNFSSRLLS
jgi:hypothetical protein